MSQPPRTLGLAIGIILIVVLAAADVLFGLILVSTPVNFITPLWVLLIAVSLPLLGFIGYRTAALVNAHYRFTQNALVIVWGPVKQIIPMADISGLILGSDVVGDLAPRGLWWPGCLVGRGHTKSVGDLMYYATTPQSGQIIVATGQGGYVISPEDIDQFVNLFEEEGRRGITEEVPYLENRPAFYDWTVWRDRSAAMMVAAGLILPFLLLVMIAIRYPSLPATIPLHYDGLGQVDRSGPPSGLLILPAIGALVWLVNGLLGVLLASRATRQNERPAAYLLWSSTIVVQVLLIVATVGLI
jgi:hypothetical protein